MPYYPMRKKFSIDAPKATGESNRYIVKKRGPTLKVVNSNEELRRLQYRKEMRTEKQIFANCCTSNLSFGFQFDAHVEKYLESKLKPFPLLHFFYWLKIYLFQ